MHNRSRDDIETFLKDLGQRPDIAKWQVKQAEHSLKILYEVYLPCYGPVKPGKEYGTKE